MEHLGTIKRGFKKSEVRGIIGKVVDVSTNPEVWTEHKVKSNVDHYNKVVINTHYSEVKSRIVQHVLLEFPDGKRMAFPIGTETLTFHRGDHIAFYTADDELVMYRNLTTEQIVRDTGYSPFNVKAIGLSRLGMFFWWCLWMLGFYIPYSAQGWHFPMPFFAAFFSTVFTYGLYHDARVRSKVSAFFEPLYKIIATHEYYYREGQPEQMPAMDLKV